MSRRVELPPLSGRMVKLPRSVWTPRNHSRIRDRCRRLHAAFWLDVPVSYPRLMRRSKRAGNLHCYIYRFSHTHASALHVLSMCQAIDELSRYELRLATLPNIRATFLSIRESSAKYTSLIPPALSRLIIP
jgi:hypothetical protein